MALEGTLQDMSLSDLFQIFRLGPKSGVLVLNSGAERGVVYVTEGCLIDAALLSAGRTVRAAQEEALIQMLLWENASFVFRHDPAVSQRANRISHDSDWIVMEGMRRRADPARALPYHKLSLDTCLQLSPLPIRTNSGVSLDMNQWRIVSLVSSNPNLRSICETAGIPHAQAIRTVAELMAIGMLEIMIPPPTRPQPRPRPARPLMPAATREAAFAGATTAPMECMDEQPHVRRSLLDAVIRRVNGL